MPNGKLAKSVEAICREIPDRGVLSPENLTEVLRKLDEIRDLLLGGPVAVKTTQGKELIGVLEIVIDEKRPVSYQSTADIPTEGRLFDERQPVRSGRSTGKQRS